MYKLSFKPAYIFYTLTLFLALYYSQGVFYPEGSIISKSILVLITIISSFFLIKSLLITSSKGIFFNLWTGLLMVNIFLFILTGNLSDPNHFIMFKFILTGMLPFFPVFYLSSKRYIDQRHLVFFLLLFIPVDILKYFYEQTLLLDNQEKNMTMNFSYSFVMLSPYIFFIKNKKLAYTLILIIIYFLIDGGKRGALFTGIAGIGIYFFYQLKYGKSFLLVYRKKKFRTLNYLQALIALVLILIVGNFILNQNEFSSSRMQNISDAASLLVRYDIYTSILSAWINTKSVINFLFGFGFAGSITLTGGYFAHNDWMEILSNLGLVGLIIYASTIFSGYLLSRKIKDANVRYALISTLVIWFLMSLGSMYYSSVFLFKHSILLGFICGYYFSRKIKLKY